MVDKKVEEEKSRYTVRPLRDFSSSFQLRMAEKEKAMQEKAEQKRKEEEAARIAVSTS